MRTDEGHFSLHGVVNTQNSRIWATSNTREYHSQSLHSPRVTVWCGFTASFILGPFFFEEPCPISSRKICTATAERYLTLLRNHILPLCRCKNDMRYLLSPSCRMVPSHIAREVKTFLLESFNEDRVISCSCKIQLPSRSPDLNSADFWLWEYLYTGAPQQHWWNWKMPFDWPSLSSLVTCYTLM